MNQFIKKNEDKFTKDADGATSVRTTGTRGFDDVFGKTIVDSTRNEADIASHYPFNPERWRFYQTDDSESNRIFLQYSTDSRYEHQRFDGNGEFDVHTIKPGSGETLIFQTPEIFRYVVGYEAFVTQALTINQSLQSGDVIRVGPFDGQDGYGLKFTSLTGTSQADMFIMRNGTEKVVETVNVQDVLNNYTRFGHLFAWYNVARYKALQSYSQDGEQINDELGKISVDDSSRGPRQGNQRIRFKITAGSSTSNLELSAGSCGWQTFGDVEPFTRAKVFNISTSGTTIDSTDTWVPFAAMRKNPDYDIVNTQITDMNIGEFTGDGSIRVLAQSVSPEKTDATGFVSPEEHNSKNSVIQTTQNITTFPDSTGTDTGSAANPGGIQLNYDVRYQSGQGTNETVSESRTATKRVFLNGDVIVLLANADVTGDVRLDIVTEQDW